MPHSWLDAEFASMNASVQMANYELSMGCGGSSPCPFTRFDIIFVPDCETASLPAGFYHNPDYASEPSAYQDTCDCGHGYCTPSCVEPEGLHLGWCTNTCMGGCQHGAGSKCLCQGNWGSTTESRAYGHIATCPACAPRAYDTLGRYIATCTACADDWHGPDCNLKLPPPVSPPPSPPPPPLPPTSPPDVALVPSSVPVGDQVTIRLKGAAAVDDNTVVFLHASSGACMGAMSASLYNGGVVADGCVSVLMMQIGLYKMCISTRSKPLHDTDFLVSTGVFLHVTFAPLPAEHEVPPPAFVSPSSTSAPAPPPPGASNPPPTSVSPHEVPGLSNINIIVIIVSIFLALALIGTCIVGWRRIRTPQRVSAGILLSDQDQVIDSVTMGHAVLPVAVGQPASESLPTHYPEPLPAPEPPLKQGSSSGVLE